MDNVKQVNNCINTPSSKSLEYILRLIYILREETRVFVWTNIQTILSILNLEIERMFYFKLENILRWPVTNQ
jgi:hypothetical protein